MISSMTGSYVGYSFAVPSNIARNYRRSYGVWQRAKSNTRGRRWRVECHRFREPGINQTEGFYIGGDKTQALKDLDFKRRYYRKTG
jgi:hypothetical protein